MNKKQISHSNLCINNKNINTVVSCLKTSHIAPGKFNKKLEVELSKYIDKKYCVLTNSGTAALHLSLLSFDISRGDEVIIPSYVCTALLNAVNMTGAKPVVADINIDDYNMSVTSFDKCITPRTKAVILPSMFGNPIDIKKFKRKNIKIISDIAQSIGSEYKNKKCGKDSDITILSLYATKVITAGEGGAILTNNKKYFEKIKDIYTYDEKDDYILRYNYKLSDLNAALGYSSIKNLNKNIIKRIKIAEKYSYAFKNMPIIIPVVKKNIKHIYYRYVIRVKNNVGKFIEYMNNNNIICRRPVYKPLHCFMDEFHCPTAEKISETAISIPIYPELKLEDIQYIISKIKRFYKHV